MSAPSPSSARAEPPDQAAVPPAAAQARQHRARVARHLLAEVPAVAAALDWNALGQAPPWMGLAADARALFIRRVGSVLLAPGLRLWIAAAPIAAARHALGSAWWDQLLQRASWPALPAQAPACPTDTALDGPGVSRLLHEAGAAVLLASLPHGALRHVASQWLMPVASLVIPAAAARWVHDLAVQMHAEGATGAGDPAGDPRSDAAQDPHAAAFPAAAHKEAA